jgi:hypothetical protein
MNQSTHKNPCRWIRLELWSSLQGTPVDTFKYWIKKQKVTKDIHYLKTYGRILVDPEAMNEHFEEVAE